MENNNKNKNKQSRFIRSQFRTVCPETYNLNVPGSEIFYCAIEKRGYHSDSNRFKNEKARLQGMDMGAIDMINELFSYFK